MNKTIEREFNKFLECLKEAGCFNDIVLVGAWAEYIYSKSKILNYEPDMSTKDLDFLIPNLRKPRNRVNLVAIAKSKGFDYVETRDGGSSYFFGEDGFEVEFLIQQRGKGDKSLPRTNIGVNAQQLTHLSVLSNNSMVVDYNGMPIKVPKPEAYVLQKMIINGSRKQKAAKDRERIGKLIGLINEDEYIRIKNTLTKKERKTVEAFENTQDIHIEELAPVKSNCIWIRPHFRKGRPVKGHWRKRRG